MSQTIKIRKGHNIKLVGGATNTDLGAVSSEVYGVSPLDFAGITPKLAVKAGAKVKAGDVLFFDKDRPEVKICSPVSGEVTEVVRGAKRKILEVLVKADATTAYNELGAFKFDGASREAVAERMMESGVAAMVTSRPYGVVASMNEQPRDIFVNGIQSGPLNGDLAVQLEGKEAAFAAGIQALRALTAGKVYVSRDADKAPVAALNAEGTSVIDLSGKHPKGLVGTQIAAVAPINKGDIVWTVNAVDVAIIGEAFTSGQYKPEYKVAVTGACANNKGYATMLQGVNLEAFGAANLNLDNTRVICGDVLTGTKVAANGYLSFGANQITAIPEGNQTEFFGWVLPGFGKFSMNRAFFAWLFPNRAYNLNTNMHGEERAFVVTGEYEKFMPMDIFPQQLLKSIMIGDIEKMEQLGIYEVVEEDFALAEVACTSKLPLQEIVRGGLDMVRKEMI